MKALTISPDGTRAVLEFNEDTVLELLQTAVGGYIEGVPTHDPRIRMFCDEEGKLKGYTPNLVATVLANVPGDIIVGTVVLTGPEDRDGNTTGLPEDLIEKESV